MIELYYNAYSVAYFAVSQEMGSKTQMAFLESLYVHEYEYLLPVYRWNKKDFISDVLYWTDYLIDTEKIDKEFPIVERDLNAIGSQLSRGKKLSDYPDIDLFFMLMRLKLLFIEGQNYMRMKLRTLLKHYGYKRRSDAITKHIQDCMRFYHIQSYLKGNQACDIKEISLDDMVTFRIREND